MYIGGHQDDYLHFLKENREFWASDGVSLTDRKEPIFVDLCHDHPGYLLANLWCAKYIQRVTGGALIGLASRWDKAGPHYSVERLRELAMSFLLDGFIDLDETVKENDAALAQLSEIFRECKGTELRKAVLSFDAANDPDLGWILYDTWLRQERCASFESGGPEMLECARHVLQAREAIRDVIGRGPVKAAVVGHYHYSPYAFIAFETARRGAPVYFQSLLTPYTLRRFASLGDIRRGRASDYLDAYYHQFVPRIRQNDLAQIERRYLNIQSGNRHFLKPATDTQVSISREDYLRDSGLDPELATVCFYAPAMCAPTHCFGPFMFDDNGDWLEQSLRFAATIPHVNFLIKRHPQDETYDTQNFIGALEETYGGAKNIHFMTAPPFTIDQMALLCDLVVTVSGTPAYEMAMRGVPTIAVGSSRYSDLGIATEPHNVADYYDLLANTGRKIELEPSRKAAALQFAFLELVAGRSRSLFLPQLHLASSDEFWKEGVRNLRAGWIAEDPLFRNIASMIEHDLPMLLNQDLLENRLQGNAGRDNETSFPLSGRPVGAFF